jgi:hypothetical protein
MRFFSKKVLLIVFIFISGSVNSQEHQNYFNDPFVQATYAIRQCPTPEGPGYSVDEIRSQSHYRVERGTSCFQSGRCRLPNSYLYDNELIARVQKFIRSDERFIDTSIWLIGQRRWVTLRGCAKSEELVKSLVSAIRTIDDVEEVINELIVLH